MEDDGSSMPPPSQPPPALNATTTTTARAGPKMSKDIGNNLNLGMAQIIVTAATPMVEDGSDKSFPPIGERGGGSAADDDTNETGSQGKAKGASAKDVQKSEDNNQQPKHKTGGGGAEAKTADMNKIIEGRQQVIEAPEVTIRLTSATPNPEDSPSSDQEQDSSEIQPLEEAEDPFNEKATAAAEASAGFEANFEANFDANFDDAFASGGGGPQSIDESGLGDDDVDVGAPKQVVGGRASIPEELDSNQLERLQNLKESNA